MTAFPFLRKCRCEFLEKREEARDLRSRRLRQHPFKHIRLQDNQDTGKDHYPKAVPPRRNGIFSLPSLWD